jgi:hypothetical protein
VNREAVFFFLILKNLYLKVGALSFSLFLESGE